MSLQRNLNLTDVSLDSDALLEFSGMSAFLSLSLICHHLFHSLSTASHLSRVCSPAVNMNGVYKCVGYHANMNYSQDPSVCTRLFWRHNRVVGVAKHILVVISCDNSNSGKTKMLTRPSTCLQCIR